MPTDTITALVQAQRGFVTAAAGCGKTEAIARSVSTSKEGRQLVLTHTHAGVKALRDRLVTFRVPSQRYRVETIAGWALRFATSYPSLSGQQEVRPIGDGWSAVYAAAERTLSSSAVQQVVAESYDGLYVDEYQDCTQNQHSLVMLLAELLPCRVLGDPLQGIFGFKEKLVDWRSDVEPVFEELPPLREPHRWKKNPALGRQLQKVRKALLEGEEVDLGGAPLSWRAATPEEQVRACYDLARNEGESIVAIHREPQTCHRFARGLKGLFTSMEEMDCKDLLKWSQAIEAASGLSRSKAVIDFACGCMTRIATEFRVVRENLEEGTDPQPKHAKKHPRVIEAVQAVASETSLEPVPLLLRALAETPRRHVYRRELWREMHRALGLYLNGTGESLRDAAWQLRNRVRRQGRQVESRTVSRTLLIKGLEFDHAIVLDAAEHDAPNLYVAMTRGSRSLTVCSANQRVRLPAPDWTQHGVGGRP